MPPLFSVISTNCFTILSLNCFHQNNECRNLNNNVPTNSIFDERRLNESHNCFFKIWKMKLNNFRTNINYVYNYFNFEWDVISGVKQIEISISVSRHSRRSLAAYDRANTLFPPSFPFLSYGFTYTISFHRTFLRTHPLPYPIAPTILVSNHERQ